MKKGNIFRCFLSRCRGDRTRTCDSLVPNQERYQLRYTPVLFESSLEEAFLKCDAKVRTFFESRKTFRNFFLFFDEKSIKYGQKANETGPKLMRLEPVYTYNVYVSEDLELEIVLCVVIADVFNHLTYALLFVTCEWDETILDILANEVAESATEVFVTWV